MKIAFVNIYRQNARGAESFSEQLAKKLSESNEVVWFGPDKKTLIVQPDHQINFLKRVFLDKASLSVLFFTLKILPGLIKENPDIIIPMNGFWQLLFCKLLLKKTIVTGHSGPGWDERWNLYLKPSFFVATTEPTARWAKKTCPWTKVVTIPYGIDPAKFKNVKPIKLSQKRPIFLCPAANVPYKQVHLAKAAVEALGKGSLLHIGHGAPLAVPPEQMPQYYKACDVVTLPSKAQENSPMVFLEAMAAGKMSVVTDSERNRWILESSGVYVDPHNTEEYANALNLALTKKPDPDNLSRFSWEIVVKKYQDLWKK